MDLLAILNLDDVSPYGEQPTTASPSRSRPAISRLSMPAGYQSMTGRTRASDSTSPRYVGTPALRDQWPPQLTPMNSPNSSATSTNSSWKGRAQPRTTASASSVSRHRDSRGQPTSAPYRVTSTSQPVVSSSMYQLTRTPTYTMAKNPPYYTTTPTTPPSTPPSSERRSGRTTSHPSRGHRRGSSNSSEMSEAPERLPSVKDIREYSSFLQSFYSVFLISASMLYATGYSPINKISSPARPQCIQSAYLPPILVPNIRL